MAADINKLQINFKYLAENRNYFTLQTLMFIKITLNKHSILSVTKASALNFIVKLLMISLATLSPNKLCLLV